jgi:hypothetical protein
LHEPEEPLRPARRGHVCVRRARNRPCWQRWGSREFQLDCGRDTGAGDENPASGQSFANLADGTYTFEVRALSTLGTAGPPATWTWTIDTVPPTATIDERKSTDTTFVFGADEAGSSLECRLLDAESDFGLCTSPRSYTDLVPGYYTFEVKAIDRAGNEGRVDQLAVFVPFDVE